MAELRFLPSRHRSWSAYRQGERTLHVTGWADTGSAIVKAEALAKHIGGQLETAMPFADVLNGLNGNFAVAVDAPDTLHVGVDAVRSIPLFYRQDRDLLTVSDEIALLLKRDDPMDERSAVEYATAGYVTGPHTLFKRVSGLQSGEYLSHLQGEVAPTACRYYSYLCSYDVESKVEAFCDLFDSALLAAFRRAVESLDGRQVLLPLSGGRDSRLVAWMFKRCGYDNLICFSYGLPDNRQSVRARMVAKALGYPWMEVPYSAALWREALASAEMRRYWSFSANGVSVPHCDDWPAVRFLSEHANVNADAVFVPGHTGDFISGGHLKYVFDPIWHDDPRAFEEAMVKKHYSLWGHLTRIPEVREAISSRLKEVLGQFSRETDEDLASGYEYWEWQERQAKLIINSVRAYEFFGFSWRLPLWDREVMEAWRGVPIALKMDKYLYRAYLASHGPAELFAGDAPKGLWSRDRALRSQGRGIKPRARALARRLRPAEAALTRYRKYRRYLRDYRRHPLGLARAYGVARYVLREPSKRHALSLLLQDFLREEYGIELSELKSRYAGGVSSSTEVEPIKTRELPLSE